METGGRCGHSSRWEPKSQSDKLLKQYISIMKLHRAILEKNLNKTGVYRSQHQILMMLDGNSNASQREIAEWLNVSTATIAVSVKKLEKGGYITRIVDQDDNRFNKLCLTESGRDIVKYSRQFWISVEDQMFRGFNQEEFDAFEQYLNRIHKNLSELMTEKTTEREDS